MYQLLCDGSTGAITEITLVTISQLLASKPDLGLNAPPHLIGFIPRLNELHIVNPEYVIIVTVQLEKQKLTDLQWEVLEYVHHSLRKLRSVVSAEVNSTLVMKLTYGPYNAHG